MKKRNLIFGALLISVLLISVASAGITGYAISLREGRTAYAGNLQVSDVQVSGETGSVSVDGNKVSGIAGETKIASDGTQVTFQRVKPAGWFSKPKVEIVVTPAPTPANIKLVGAGAVGSGATTHTHLSDYEVVWVEFMNITGYNSSLHSAFYNPDVPKPLYPSLGDGSGEIRINGDQNGKLLQFVGECPQNKIVINAGYSLFGYNIYNSAAVISENYDDEVYYLTIEEPFGFSNAEEDNERIDRVSLRLSCARVEPTLHNFSLDY